MLARLVSSEGCEEEYISFLSSRFGCLLVTFGISWLCIYYPNLCLHLHIMLSQCCTHVCVQIFSFYKLSHSGLGPTLMTLLNLNPIIY